MKILYLLFFLLSVQISNSQFLHIYDVNIDNYPDINAKFYAVDENNEQIKDIQADDLKILENGIERDILSISCNNPAGEEKLSTILAIDISQSMAGERIEWVKDAAYQWIADTDSTKEETSILAFNDESFLYADYFINTDLLRDAVDKLETGGGTNYEAAFLDPKSGILDQLRKSNYRPVVVFLTDGLGITTDFKKQEILNRLLENGAVFYAISIEFKLPPEIKEIAETTGGQYFEISENPQEISEIYSIVRNFAKDLQPCEISWKTSGCLLGREALLELSTNDITELFTYTAPQSKFPEFSFENGLFEIFECNTASEREIRVYAENQPIEVFGINQTGAAGSCDEFSFQFVNRTPPFVIDTGDYFTLRVRYNPLDSRYKVCEIEIDASSCLNNKLFLVANCQGASPGNSAINVLYPDGGEKLLAGTKGQILWNGTTPGSNITVDYSVNNGASWRRISEGKLERRIDWDIPNEETNEALVKVTQYSSQIGERIQNIQTDSVDILSLAWHPGEIALAAACSDSTVRVYNSLTGELLYLLDRPFAPDYFLDMDWSPDGIRLSATGPIGTIIYNTSTKSVITSLQSGQRLDWSNDGDFIAVTNGNQVTIYNAVDYSVEYTISDDSDITALEFDRNSERLAIATSTESILDTIEIYKREFNFTENRKTSLVDVTDQSRRTSYLSISWSKDGNYIFASSEANILNSLEYWDVNNQQILVKNYDDHGSLINAVSHNPEDNIGVSVDDGFNINVWNFNGLPSNFSLELANDFTSTGKSNRDVVWSPDGSRFAVASTGSGTDKFITMYSVKQFPLMTSTSDSVFSIFKDGYTCDNIDMGEVVLGKSIDSTLDNIVNYNSVIPFEIDSVVIKGTDRAAFGIVLNSTPFIVSDSDIPTVSITFSPTKEGIHNAQLYFYTDFGLDSCSLTGNGIKPDLTFESIDFGQVLVGQDSLITKAIIFNNGTADIEITGAEIAGPDGEPFDILDSNGDIISSINSYTLVSGSSTEFNVLFSPNRPVLSNGTVRFIYVNEDGNEETASSKLIGEGIKPELSSIDEVAFRRVECLSQRDTNITIYNVGKGPLTIFNNTSISGNDFEILTDLSEDITIEEADSLQINIRFIPTRTGILNGTLELYSNSQSGNNPYLIGLSGRALNTDFEYDTDKTILIGIDDNTPVNNQFELINTGETELIWNLPYQSINSDIEVVNVSPNPTLPGDTAIVEYLFNGGNKGEEFRLKFAPEPVCADSILIQINIKNTFPTIFVQVDRVDFLAVCSDSATRELQIFNNGEEDLEIDNITINNNQSNSFSYNLNSNIISSGESATLNLKFENISDGFYQSELIINSNDPSNNPLEITLNGYRASSDLSFDRNEIDFQFIGTNRPPDEIITITNNGTYRQDLSGYEGRVLENYFLIKDISPSIIDANEQSTMIIEYLGPDNIDDVFNLVFSDTCGNENIINANVIQSNNGRATITISEERKNIGEIFEVTLNLSNIDKLDEAGVETIRGNLVFNRSLMVPTNSDNFISGDTRYVPFEFESLINGEQISIEMKSLWGNDSCSSIGIDDLEATGNTSTVSLQYIEGSICLIDLCYEGGARLFDNISFSEEDNLLSANPIPAENVLNLEYRIIEEGIFKLKLLNSTGEMVKELLNENLSSGEYKNQFDLKGISSGTYYLVYETLTIKELIPIIVIK